MFLEVAINGEASTGISSNSLSWKISGHKYKYNLPRFHPLLTKMVNTRRVYIYQTSTFYCFKIGNKKLISSRIDFILLCAILTLCRSYHIIRDLTKIYIYYNIFIIHLFSRSCALFYIASIFSRIELYTRYAAAPLVRLGGRCVCGYDPLFVIKFKTSLMIRGPNFHSWSWWIRE